MSSLVRIKQAAAVLTGCLAAALLPLPTADAATVANLNNEQMVAGAVFNEYYDTFTDGMCDPSGISTISQTVSGSASGPYPGTFTETVSFKIGPQTQLMPLGSGDYVSAPEPFGPVIDYQAQFTITSGSTTITGTKTFVDKGLLGFCASFTADAHQVDRVWPQANVREIRFNAAATYQALIQTPSGTYQDAGSSAASFYAERVVGSVAAIGPLTETLSTSHVPTPADTTPPQVTGAADRAPNANGWYNGPVTVTWSASDPDPSSGIATEPTPTTLATDGADQLVTSSPACDNAGNCATGTFGPVSIDQTPPTVSVTGAQDSSAYVLGAVPAVGCTASDALSGLDGDCAVTVTGGTSNGVGSYTATATARDRAGNVATATANYQVTYGFTGFLQPVNDTAHQVGLTTSVFKAGSTVPLKFQLTDANGLSTLPTDAPTWLAPVQGSAMTDDVNEPVYTDPADSGSTYRLSDGTWIYNWSTKGLPAGYFWQVGVRLDDGTVHLVTIALR